MFERLPVTDTFKNSIMSALTGHRLSHALIFEGSDEQTRLAVAKEVARALVCKGEDKPCGYCYACKKAESGNHPDIHIIVKEEKNTFIPVDAVRELKSKALILPNDGDKSVFIINQAQYMNPQAQNALLKIFEEPSGYVCFILCCDSKASMLETIISRATIYSLGEEKAVTEKNKELIRAEELSKELINIFFKANEFEFLKKTAEVSKDKVLFRATLEAMLLLVRDALVLQSSGNSLINEQCQEVLLIKNKLTQKKTLELVQRVQELISDIDSSANLNLTLTRFSSVLYNVKSH